MFSAALVLSLLVVQTEQKSWSQMHITPDNRLASASPILGQLDYRDGPMTRWMSHIPDDTPIESLNIPGTHDAAAWNYTGTDNKWYNCQEHPLFDQLDAGIRLLDLRFGWTQSHDKLVFYHADALLSPEATVDDVLYGLHKWIELHKTEILLISLKVDNGPTDAQLQQYMYDLITGVGRLYWSQISGQLGTVGQARGKLVLLRRFSWDLLPASVQTSLPGINLADNFSDNDPDFIITYNAAENLTAHIEDLYQIDGDPGAKHKVDTKIFATIGHIEHAVQSVADESAFWISFASGAGIRSLNETVTPKILAKGDGATTSGVNTQLNSWLASHPSPPGRFGAILLDFYGSEPTLVSSIIGQGH